MSIGIVAIVPVVRESKSEELFQHIRVVFVRLGAFPSLALSVPVAGGVPDHVGGAVPKIRAPQLGRSGVGNERV